MAPARVWGEKARPRSLAPRSARLRRDCPARARKGAWAARCRHAAAGSIFACQRPGFCPSSSALQIRCRALRSHHRERAELGQSHTHCLQTSNVTDWDICKGRKQKVGVTRVPGQYPVLRPSRCLLTVLVMKGDCTRSPASHTRSTGGLGKTRPFCNTFTSVL